MGLSMSEKEFSKFLEATGNTVADQGAVKGGQEIPIRLYLTQKSKLRWGHFILLGWAILSILGGYWFSLPVLLLFVIAVYDIHRYRVASEQLLTGLQAAGILQIETKETK